MSFPKDRVVVGSLCYVFREETVLLLKRNRMPQRGLWTAPGGKLEQGESPDECVIREVQEETGLLITAPELRAVVTIYDRDYPIHWLLFIYKCESFSGDLRPHTEEGELRWITLDDLDAYPRPYADTQYWAHLCSDDSQVWRGKFTYDTPHDLISEARY